MMGREEKYQLVLWCQSKQTLSSVFGIGLSKCALGWWENILLEEPLRSCKAKGKWD